MQKLWWKREWSSISSLRLRPWKLSKPCWI